MESNNIQNLIKTLKTAKNKQTIYEKLSRLVSLLKEEQKYTLVLKYGGIRIVVGYLSLKYNNIIDVSLSLLANCCTQQDCAIEVIRCDGLKILLNLLKKCKQDSILCRACRLIGNIARFDNYATAFYNHGVVPLVVDILNKSTNNETEEEETNTISMDTQAMAVRVLRILWKQASQRTNMTKDGVIRAVSLVLIQHTEKWWTPNRQRHIKKLTEKFLLNVLDCLLLFSNNKSINCVEQISADGFKALVKLMNLYPYFCVKCLTNLSTVATSRSEIANAAAVKCIVSLFYRQLSKKPDEPYPDQLLAALTLFCKHPMNCLELKKAGGLELMLQLLKNCKSIRQEYILVRTLNVFKSNRTALDILIAHDVVPIFIDCIERNLRWKHPVEGTHQYVKKVMEKRQSTLDFAVFKTVVLGANRCRSSSSDSSSAGTSIAVSDASSSVSGSSSPSKYSRTTSDNESSPASTPSCTPPRSSGNESDDNDDDDSADYSPICTDVEENGEEEEDLETSGEEKSTEPDTDVSFEEYYDDDTNYKENALKERINFTMVALLLEMIHREYPTLAYGSYRTLSVLLKYLRECHDPEENVKVLIHTILLTRQFRIQLYTSGIMFTIYKMNKIQHNLDCAICYILHSSATKYLNCYFFVRLRAKDALEVVDILRKTNGEEKKICLLSCTLLTSINVILLKILQDSFCLETFIKLISEKPEFRYHIVDVLSQLAQLIEIKSPVPGRRPKNYMDITDKYEFDPSCKNVVNIGLDDGSIVKADKDFLTARSEYFKAMLAGRFKESTDDIVKVKGVSKNALHFLINILKLDFKDLNPQPLDVNIYIILETVVLTDIYLMVDATSWLTQCVEEYIITPENASDIYKWSLTTNTGYFRMEVIAYTLTHKMSESERVSIFENMFDKGLTEEFVSDIDSLMERFGCMRIYN